MILRFRPNLEFRGVPNPCCHIYLTYYPPILFEYSPSHASNYLIPTAATAAGKAEKEWEEKREEPKPWEKPKSPSP